ncbi:MAG: copper amine oxidase N-terminal domain-containing protein [Syntrophomonadaceae bacterium]|nr:copper amine oxidase N-terminal domain-containing protein [Syntrophomonadaceae bacterium]MDD3024204.1 copper amine oxidase N-terminal domain-containing protein [Syntrophomonadaceae bacterium]
MRKATVIAAIFSLLLFTAPAAADPRYDFQVEIKKQNVNFPDQKPYIDTLGDRSFIPLKIVADALDVDVQWDAKQNAAIIKSNGQDILMEVGAKTILVNGIEKELNGRAEITGNCMLVPADFFSKGLGFNMYWDYGTRLVIIF